MLALRNSLNNQKQQQRGMQMLQLIPIVTPAIEQEDVTTTAVIVGAVCGFLAVYSIITVIGWTFEYKEKTLFEYVQGQYRFVRHLMTRLW